MNNKLSAALLSTVLLSTSAESLADNIIMETQQEVYVILNHPQLGYIATMTQIENLPQSSVCKDYDWEKVYDLWNNSFIELAWEYDPITQKDVNDFYAKPDCKNI